jgi:UDP-N-acetylmuramate dehydrogenase
MEILEQVPLAPYTSIGLGGRARYLVECRRAEEIGEAFRFAHERGVPALVLGGGSNIIFADAGFPGLVVRVTGGGYAFRESGDLVEVKAGAGVDWDGLVAESVSRGYSGIECLSGIPGTVGGTPIQNVGAYGQEVAETVVAVSCLTRAGPDAVTFGNADCGFGYRTSRFKREDRDRYVVLDVTLRLRRNAMPVLRYQELADAVAAKGDLASLPPREAVRLVRDAVLALRRRKGMVLDPADPDTRSVGSFFVNPVLSPEAFARLERRWRDMGGSGAIPTFPAADGIKVPAAWLVEQAGFKKGYRKDGVGISRRHALALVNLGGTTAQLLALAQEIETTVKARLGVALTREPVVVG